MPAKTPSCWNFSVLDDVVTCLVKFITSTSAKVAPDKRPSCFNGYTRTNTSIRRSLEPAESGWHGQSEGSVTMDHRVFFFFFLLLLQRRNSNPVLKHSNRVTPLLCFRTIFRRTSSGCRAVKNFGELVQIFPFQEAVYAAWKHLQKAKRNKRTQATDEAECFLSTWQEALAQLESCDTKMRKSTMTYLSSRNLGPQKISVKFRGPNSSRF